MSLFDYQQSLTIAAQNRPFYALLMAAMRQADSDNVELLKHAFPATWDELHARYNAPGGLLESEQEARA